MAEAKFYLVEDLVTQCEEALKKKDDVLPCCIVRLATSAKQEKLLVSQSDKVSRNILMDSFKLEHATDTLFVFSSQWLNSCITDQITNILIQGMYQRIFDTVVLLYH